MLKRGEQGVELGEVGAVVKFEFVDLGNAGSEGVLERKRRNRQLKGFQISPIHRINTCRSAFSSFEFSFDFRPLECRSDIFR